MPAGSCRCAWEMAVCTSWAAASTSRERSNCRVIWLLDWVLLEVTVVRPGRLENCCSRGRATALAMVSESAPGSEALTCRVGKSMLGRSLIASWP